MVVHELIILMVLTLLHQVVVEVVVLEPMQLEPILELLEPPDREMWVERDWGHGVVPPVVVVELVELVVLVMEELG